MAKKYNIADIRFNNGNGALLCNRCSIIIDYGFDHEDKLHFCEDCEPHASKWALGELIKQSQEMGDYDTNDISRVEVIGPEGREYVRYFEPEEWMHFMIQDEGRTLKIFIEDCK